jgi:small-conductance mechanosensitive channel
MFENQIINALATVALFWLGSYAVTFAITMIGKLASKTKTNLDDKIIKAIKLPIRYLAIILGFFYGFKNFEMLNINVRGKEFGVADFALILALLLAGFMTSRLLKTVFIWYGERENAKLNQTMFVFIRKMISMVVYVIAIMIIFGQLGIQIAPLLAGLGIAGLAIAMGLKSTLENLFGALFLIIDRSINIGDWIQLEDGTKAYVEDITWRTVHIKTVTGNTVIVPNSVFVGEKISSYDFPQKSFKTSIAVGVAYDTDLERAEYIALQAGEKVIRDEGISVQINNPTVRYNLLGPSTIDFKISLQIDRVQDEGRIKHALIKEIVKQFKENNIEIPFPQMVIHKDN